MFHISNVDDTKSEWNVNEAHIIIPMIDSDVVNKESDKTLTNSLTLNSLEVGDQAMLNNALEHSFVIGLDKSLFEIPNYKSDLVIIQNSDLKLLSCNNDLKNSVAYALSYVDQDKNEILWHSSQKDRIFTNDKPILEVRDELDFQDSVNDLEKNEINLVNIDSDITSQVPKTDEILQEEIINEGKNEKPQYINYLTVAQNSEIVPNVQYLDPTKPNENYKSVNKLVECDFKSKSACKEAQQSVTDKSEKSLFSDAELEAACNKSEASDLVEYVKYKTEEKEIIVSDTYKNHGDEKLEETYKGVRDSLPEKSLPLKKKAKMKRTVILCSSESQKLKQDVVTVNQEVNLKSSAGKKTKLQSKAINSYKKPNETQTDLQFSNNSNIPINKIKRKKDTKLKTSCKKSKQCIPESPVNENTSHDESKKVEDFKFDKNKFRTIYDLIECLRKCKMINPSVWQTLNSGLKEMDVDILKEINAKEKEINFAKSRNYSPQLKAFALVLYFKQPSAFKYLSQVYNGGWPSLETIKDWKQQINSHQRPILARVERNAKDVSP